MLSHLGLTNLGPIAQAEFDLVPGVNVLVGENGTGKSLALRTAWLVANHHEVLSTFAMEPGQGISISSFAPLGQIHHRLRSELNLINTEDLINTKNEISKVTYKYKSSNDHVFSFKISKNIGFGQSLDEITPPIPIKTGRAFLFPASDPLQVKPSALELLDKHQYWVPPSLLALSRSLTIQRVKLDGLAPPMQALVSRVEAQTGAALPELNAKGEFQWKNRPLSLMAEGHRKLAAAALLLANESIEAGDTLLWDEPEANLNPKLLGFLAEWLVELAAAGVQVFLSTHSLFLLRAFEIARKARADVPVRYFALHPGPGGVVGEASEDLLDLQHLSSLEAELQQEDAYLAAS